MEAVPNNPVSNVLGPGLTDETVSNAIKESGYPLQLSVARTLRDDFSLVEEWGFSDPETGAVRTIDLVASKELYDWKGPQPRVRPALNLIIECKQSELPYVFFQAGAKCWLPDFPLVSGLRSNLIVITSDDDPSTWSHRPLDLLEVHRHPFLVDGPRFCVTFSKCVRKGSDIVLSGSDPYQSIMFPILKAVCHFDSMQRPPATAHYFDCHLVIGLAILDAPMVAVEMTDSGSESRLVPWVRVVRHEPCEGEHEYDRYHAFGVDVVHKDYLRNYIREHVLPFADEFSRLVLKHGSVLAECRGFVPGMRKSGWTGIEARLQEASANTTLNRGKAALGAFHTLRKKPPQKGGQ
jgi:hypothetical protein